MTGFFAYRRDEPPGSGFALYGKDHLFILAALLVGVVLMTMFYDRADKKGRLKMLRVTAWIILLSEIVRQVSFIVILGYYPLQELPLHLCGISIFINVAHATKPNKFTGEILYALGLPGTLAALAFCDWTNYPLMTYQCIQSFVAHALHAVFVIMQLKGGDIRPSLKKIWRPIIFLLVIVPPIYWFNTVFGTNFFFINAGSPGSPLEILIELMGDKLFLIGYAGLLVVVWVVMYLPWVFIFKERKIFR
ncbi:MAG: TIGR02206 family membrane protein [Clostridiales bacterium]|jgi:hypothetical integral membrane protein (TIGR02206 family)|nr:TIGR02206 family membrane protein [Clostridiales bacterium]